MDQTNQLLNCRKTNYKEESDSKYLDGKSFRTHCGLCCVCHTLPTHSRTYYGHLFCINCFHKYIWTPSKHECSGDVKKAPIPSPDQ